MRTSNLTTKGMLFCGSALLLTFATLGCATKKHVRQAIAPVETRVGEVEKQNTTQQLAIAELEASVSRADERATEADNKATTAGQEAARANQEAARASKEASQAGQTASGAQQMAERNQTRIGGVETTVANLDNYKLKTDSRVLFGFDKWQLTKEAKDQLDALAKDMQDKGSYIIEVHGFTDTTGGSVYNLELSRKRAQAVVRYLTIDRDIPLRRIYVVGAGEAAAMRSATGKAANTRETRKQNRRVDVKVFTLDTSGSGSQVTSLAAPSQP